MAALPNTILPPIWVYRASLPRTHIANFDAMLKNVDSGTRDSLTRLTHLRNEMKNALDNENPHAGIAVCSFFFFDSNILKTRLLSRIYLICLGLYFHSINLNLLSKIKATAQLPTDICKLIS